MNLRRLGHTDLAITPIGLGAWAIGGGDWCLGWGPQKDGDSIATIRRAIDRGINWIDTAAVYGLGRSERIIVRALRGLTRSYRPFVFTTVGFEWDDLGNVSRNLTAASIRRQVDDSLARLDVDVLDLVQLDPSSGEACRIPSLGGTLVEAWGALTDLQRAGKVRALGASNCSPRQLDELRRVAPVASVQAAYSLLHRDVENELLPYCTAQGISMLAASPMASGLLTGAMTPERLRLLPCNDWRRGSAAFQADEVARAQPIVEQLREVARRHGVRAPGAAAVAWVLRQAPVTTAVAGARTPHQVDDLIPAASLELTADDVVAIERALTVSVPAAAAGR